MSDKLKFTEEVESFIQQWTALYHLDVGEYYHIPYYFKKIKPADPLKGEVLWELVSHENLPDEIKKMILEVRDREKKRKDENTANKNVMTGIELIAKERQEQIEKHGYNLEHDSEHHNDSSLSWNAAVLASPRVSFIKHDHANQVSFEKVKTYVDWKLPSPHYAPNMSNVIIDNMELPKKERVKQLVVAGALIAAEIDRISRCKHEHTTFNKDAGCLVCDDCNEKV